MSKDKDIKDHQKIDNKLTRTLSYLPRFDDTHLEDPWVRNMTQEVSVDVLSPTRQSQYPSFRQIRGANKPEIFVLEKMRQILGRSPDVELFIDLPELSREHAEITNDDGEFRITDLDSKNGMYLNGLKIHSAVLRNGDMLQFASSCFIFDGAF